MNQSAISSLHDRYAADYDAQVRAYDCYITDVLFGLCYEFIRPGQRLLDVGIGSGLSAQLFAQAGLEVHGMDFSPAMLEKCQAKGFAAELKQHNILQVPWPYPSAAFQHVTCCGVLHFIAGLEDVFCEAARVLGVGGVFAFTTRLPAAPVDDQQPYDRQVMGDFDVFSHAPPYIQSLLAQHAFRRLKLQKCCVGDDLFMLWVTRR